MGENVASDLARCPRCAADVPSTASFCSHCGAQLGVSATTLPPPASPDHSQARSTSLSTGPSQPPEQQASTVIADPLIGATVADRYRIEQLIGRGGMGVVYKVEHAKIGKVMALKLLTGELARNRETVSRFKREALMVSKLSHPNTVQVFDYGSSGGLTYLAMEYLSGQDLGELIERQGPRPFSQMAKIVIQACGALSEAHDVGMVHRDIKPENIFLTRTPSGEEMVKVLDFGLAKLRESRDLNEITSSGNIVGTPYYMPPEQVRGEDVDARGDVYAMCALLYTCVTGTHVFEAPSPVAVLTQQLTKIPVPPHERAPELQIPPSVSDIILKGLEKDPADRFQSAEELEQALRGELQGESFTTLKLPESGAFARPAVEATATRGEVERYERRLKRRERIGKAIVAFSAIGLGYAGFHFYREAKKPPVFQGRELEPNHEVETATRVPLGRTAKGRLGRRLGKQRGDQDNFRITVPKGAESRTVVSLNLSGLPNMGICAWIFKAGSPAPLYRYCGGGPEKSVLVPALSFRPGDYLFVVKQDRNEYWDEKKPPWIENVSDDYELKVDLAEANPSKELEPNEDENLVKTPTNAQTKLSLDPQSGATRLSGLLNVMGDEDVVCATGLEKARFFVSDAEGGTRPLHAALQVTPLGGPAHKIPVRLHAGRQGFEISERDQTSPWKGPETDLSATPCVRLKLVPNPWAPRPHPIVAPSSNHEWTVSLEPSN